MNKEQMIGALALWVSDKDANQVEIEEFDIWVNNSDGEGEDFNAYAIGYLKDEFGLFVGENDFFPFSELSQEEVEMVYDTIIGG